jgi:molybdopterin converting factor small subunit
MPIRIAFPAQFAELIGGADSVTVDGATVGEALARLTERHPALASLVWPRGAGPAPGTGGVRGALNPVIVVFLNGEDVRHAGGLQAPLREGDELTVISAVEGG